MTPKILFLAPIVEDAAIRRRTSMLRTGGAAVKILGFRRSARPISTLDDCPVVDLGRSFNARFVQRILLVFRTLFRLGQYRESFAEADVILARNLEMLAIGCYGRWCYAPKANLAYEVLDIHRLLLNDGIVGRMLRRLEGRLTRHVSLVLTSSPAFTENYFRKRSEVRAPVYLIENKVPGWMHRIEHAAGPVMGPPWIIGWFGIIRCAKSLQALKKLVAQSNGKVQVVIRGKPALDQFEDFEAQAADTPGLSFLGPYKNPEDLRDMYGAIHFIWAIDHFEEGQNSNWLLPNRLYEGGAYGVVPLAENGVETGHFLKKCAIGININSIENDELSRFFGGLAPERYQALKAALNAVPQDVWVADDASCRAVVEMLFQRSNQRQENLAWPTNPS